MFDRLSISFYGASHEPKMGAIVSGLEIGSTFSNKHIVDVLQRRSTNSASKLSSTRMENDEVHFIKGVVIADDMITVVGKEVEFYIENKNYLDVDYKEYDLIPRPSHADYAAYKKYGTFPVGGGKYSGRMTALICVIGSIAMDILSKENIAFESYIKEHGEAKDGDSFGGIVSVIIKGLKAGQLGDALFDGLEGKLSYSIFGIPAVKGVEFGDGFGLAKMTGKEANDELSFDGNNVILLTNHMGGIDGGISNGNPITINVAIKPTPSIKLEQNSVDLKTNENVKISIEGRHDMSIVPRVLPCLESATAIAILDEYYKAKQTLN